MREINAQFAIESLLDDMGLVFESLDEYIDEDLKKTASKIGTKVKNAYYDYYADPYIKFWDKHTGAKKIHLHKSNPFYYQNKEYYRDMAERDKRRKREKEAKKESVDDLDIDLEFWDFLS